MPDPLNPFPGDSTPAAGSGTREQPPSSSVSGVADWINLLKSLFLGVTLTAFFYEVFPVPFLDPGRLLSVFDNWVSEVIVGLSLWSLFLLLFKYLAHRRQAWVRRAFDQPAIRAVLGRDLPAREADAALTELTAELRRAKRRRFDASILYIRVQRVLRAFEARAGKEQISDLLQAQAEIDVKRLATSYSIIQFFIWAIPIWGFIGTVLGIADAVQQFSAFIQTAETGAQFTVQMRSALGGVTGGLAVAFNTTFVALVLVMPVMLIASMLQKAEEELLLSIEEFCLEELLPRLRIVPGDAAGEGFDDHLDRILRLSNTWLARLEPAIAGFNRQTEMLSHQLAGVQPLVKDFTDRLLQGRSVRLPAVEPAQPEGRLDEEPNG